MSATRATKTPVTILTGFLGSGKTSLLNGALKDTHFSNSAVVVNEFGEIAIDHALVSEGRENIVLTEMGCLCCAALDSLSETLADLFGLRARNETPFFERIFIETTGLADPAPILRTLLRDPIVSHFARLDGLICAVDAAHCAKQLCFESEAQAQVAMADRIIVTKTDMVTQEAISELGNLLKRFNSSAEILQKTNTPDFDRLLGSISVSPAPRRQYGGRDREDGSVGAHVHDHHPHMPRHDPGVASLSFWLDEQTTWKGLAEWTQWVRTRFGPALLRCKGLLNVENTQGPVVLQGVQDIFDTTRLVAWPDADRRSRLVLIGRGLVQSEIASSLPMLSAQP